MDPSTTSTSSCDHCNKQYEIPTDPGINRVKALQRFRTHKSDCSKNPKNNKQTDENNHHSNVNNTNTNNNYNNNNSNNSNNNVNNTVTISSTKSDWVSLHNIKFIVPIEAFCIKPHELENYFKLDYFKPPPKQYESLFARQMGACLKNALQLGRQDINSRTPSAFSYMRIRMMKEMIRLLWMLHRFDWKCAKCSRKITSVSDFSLFECDHINPEGKLNCVSSLVTGHSPVFKLLEELEKCQLLDAACHLQKTQAEYANRQIPPTMVIVNDYSVKKSLGIKRRRVQ